MSPDLDAISSRPLADFTSEEAAAAMARSFEGYLVPFRITAQAFERRFRSENLDAYASRVYVRDGTPAGTVLVARRGWTSRIAAMGIVPEMRGQGLGRRVMEEATAEARQRGDRAVLLEAIAHNTPAVQLYTSLGFQAMRKLVGYRREAAPAPSPTGPEIQEIDPLEFARVVTREGEPDLPWMLAAETLAAATPPARAFHLEHRAYALVADPGDETLVLTALVVPRQHRRQGWASRLLATLDATFPRRPWVIKPLVPEDLVPAFFTQLGWERQDLQQIEMRLELSGQR